MEASPATFAETVHVLAEAGTLITPSVFVRYNVESRVADFPPNSVPQLAWSMAVADVTNQSLWVSVISLLSAAENLTEDQLCLAYEAACYAATMGLIEDTTLDAYSFLFFLFCFGKPYRYQNYLNILRREIEPK